MKKRLRVISLTKKNDVKGSFDGAVVAGNAMRVKFTLATALTGTLTATVTANQIKLTDTNGVAVK